MGESESVCLDIVTARLVLISVGEENHAMHSFRQLDPGGHLDSGGVCPLL